MPNYALIENNKVREIIKDEGIFKGIPLSQRYTKEIVDACVKIPEDVIVKEGMLYKADTKEFLENVEEVVDNEGNNGEQITK